MNYYEKCDYCGLMLEHIGILKNEMAQFEPGTDYRYATMLELKCYYWLVKAYYDKILVPCNCAYKNVFCSVLKDLYELFEENDIKIEIEKKKCDICKILPCELFSLLDMACTISDQQKMELMYAELQYQVFISWIYAELIGQCFDCDAFVDYKACIEATCEYLNDRNIHALQEFVYFWKIATNNDEIWSSANNLSKSENIISSEVKLDDHITVYLDFNVYNQYEKNPEITKFLKQLSDKKKIDVIYSGTHLEEIIRMNDKRYALKRIQSIQTLTQGKIAVVGANGNIVICVEDISARMKQVERYQRMNKFAEERACIVAEAREHLSFHIHDEKRDKAIGDSSIKEMINNSMDDTGEKINPNLPNEDNLNEILRYVGIGDLSIKEYQGILNGGEQKFYQIRTAIVSMANLLNVIGLYGDKITKKSDTDAVYPIYHKKSYRTIRSGYYDNDHLSFASICTYFVTTDTTLYKKAKEIYEFLGISTTPVLLEEFIDMQNDI